MITLLPLNSLKISEHLLLFMIIILLIFMLTFLSFPKLYKLSFPKAIALAIIGFIFVLTNQYIFPSAMAYQAQL
jgi:Na+/phosphate symporter